jgi:asparagine synthase (glutamine-hydrolysing)
MKLWRRPCGWTGRPPDIVASNVAFGMCGIAGFYNLDGSAADPAVLREMLDLQRHRGPDDQGLRLFSLKSGQSCALRTGAPDGSGRQFEGAVGCNRLAILDLSSRGHLPMSNPQGTVFIAYNGEIYNAFDLKKDPALAEVPFRSQTDTEVLLHLYEQVGWARMLDRIDGMFALCIVDLRRREIYLARDPFGIKPLYWVQQGRTFLFSSEVKSFLVHPQFMPEIDLEALDEFLAFRYCAADRFLLRGVRPLPPGYWLRLTEKGHFLQPYWQIPDFPDKARLDKRRAMEKMEALLQGSIKSQLRADVPLGCQLSGGIDSSLVTLYARRSAGPRLETFSVIFRDAAYSEEPWMAQAATAAVVRNHRFLLDEPYVLDHLCPATWHLDQPLNFPCSVGVYLLAERARPDVTVLLCGEGADELLGGYERFYEAALRARLAPWMPILGKIPPWGRRLARRLRPGASPADAFILSTMACPPQKLWELRPQADLERALDRRRSLFEEGHADYLSNCMRYEMRTWLVDALVSRDKMTMAHSIETRVPFLDKHLVSFARSLPTDYLVGSRILPAGGAARNTKILLKELAGRTFGEAFVYRRKMGFLLPLVTYFAHPRFREMMEDQFLPGMRRRNWLEEKVVRRWWGNGGTDPQRIQGRLWVPVALEVWAQLFLDRQGVARAGRATRRAGDACPQEASRGG